MTQTKFTKFVTLLVTMLFTLTFVNAAADFSITPGTTSTDLIMNADSKVITYTIENIGNETLNLDLTITTPVLSTESVTSVLSKSNILNLLASDSTSFTVTHSANTISEGAYIGKVTATNQADSNNNKESITTLNLLEAKLEISLSNNTVSLNGEINKEETKSFRIENTGSVDLNNIKFSFTDLEGENYGDEIENNDLDMDDDGFDIEIGDSQRVEIEIDVPKGIEVDLYKGTVTIETSEGYEFEFDVEIDVDGGDAEVEFTDDFYIKNGLLTIAGEPGESIDDYDIRVKNIGDVNIRDLKIELKGDLEEIYGDYSIDESQISFSVSEDLSIDESDYEDIELRVDLLDSVKTGTYSGEIRVLSSTGKIYDKLRLEVKVTGDIYIDNVDFESKVNQNENLELSVTIKNQGSKTEKSVKVTGTIIGIDLGNTDIIESSNTFLLTAGQERTERLRFEIPESARDGTHSLELTLTHEDGSITELLEVEVTRPDNKLNMESAGIGKNVIKCDNSLYVFAKVKNIGKYDQQATFTSEIVGTSIKNEVKNINVDVDEKFQQNFNLNLEGLEAGSYEVLTKVAYQGFFLRDSSTVIIKDCNGASTGLDIEPIEDELTGNETITSEDTVDIFGQELEQNQIYLIVGITIITLLIIVSLFFI